MEVLPWLSLLTVFVVPIMGYLVRQQVQHDKRINACERQGDKQEVHIENLAKTADRIEKKVDKILESQPPRGRLESVHEA